VTFDFRKSCPWRQAKLFGEDVEDAGETDERGKFRDGAARKILKIKLAALQHEKFLTTRVTPLPPRQ
jgi:hypothetical protein